MSIRPSPALRPSSSPAVQAPSLVAGAAHAACRRADGETELILRGGAAPRAAAPPPLVVPAPATARRLGLDRLRGFDLLELFAFVRPARFCLPTARGLAAALSLPEPHGLEAESASLGRLAEALLAEIASAQDPDPDLLPTARAMTRGGWLWGPAVLAALGDDPQAFEQHRSTASLEPWRRLAEWAEHAPEPPAGSQPVDPAAARARLAQLLGGGPEPPPQQADYASAGSQAFLPRAPADVPRPV